MELEEFKWGERAERWEEKWVERSYPKLTVYEKA